MSFKVQLLECPLCKATAYAFPHLPSAYIFPTGELLSLRWARGWCRTCSRIRQLEDLPNLEALQTEEAEILKLAGTNPDGLDWNQKLKLAGMDLYRRLLGVRQHPNRCLDCGSTDIEHWEFDNEGLATSSPHGGCPGLCVPVEDPDEIRLALVEDAEAYSIEGEHLGRLSQQPGKDGTEMF